MLTHGQLFATPWKVAHQAPLSVGFFKARILEWLPFPSSGDLLYPGTEPRSPVLQADSLLSEPPGKPRATITPVKYKEAQKHSYSTTSQGCGVGEMPPIQEAFMVTEYTPAELVDIGARF